MKYDEFSAAYEMAHLIGWRTGRYDHKTITDHTGFFSLIVNGEIAAIISCVKYGDSYANIGLYICKQEHRGKGYAYKLWKFAVDTIKGRNAGLDANMLQIYRYILILPNCNK
jgi:predicted GNAT family acetyltransferase